MKNIAICEHGPTHSVANGEKNGKNFFYWKLELQSQWFFACILFLDSSLMKQNLDWTVPLKRGCAPP